MHLLKFFFHLRSRDLTLAMLAGIVSGASNVLFVAVVNSAMRPGVSASLSSAILLLVLCVGSVLGRYASDILLVHLSQHVVYDLRMRLSREILLVQVRRLELLGGHSILATLTEDVNALTNLALNLPSLCVNLAIFICVVGYLFYLTPRLAAVVIAVIVVGVTGHTLIRRQGKEHFVNARDAHNELMKRFRTLTDGIKELKLHEFKRAQFISRLDTTAAALRRELVAGSSSYTAAACWAQLIFFGLLTSVVLLAPRWSAYRLVPGLLSGAVLALMAIRGPVETLVGMFLNLARTQVSLKKIEQLGLSLTVETELLHQNQDAEICMPDRGNAISTIEFRDVIHSYAGKEGVDFLLGPINLLFCCGEIIFISGGNGSGKTTLVKLLTGLYVPEAGEIVLNGKPVTSANRDYYRSLFTAIFADFYLDDMVACTPSPELDLLARQYLQQVHLEHKVAITNGRFSTVELSQGQRKRLALVAAHLENRSIYVFDEWAADQDVSFRHVFYHQILPDLKRQGKTLFVISHDQQYFDVADRVIVLTEGKVWTDNSREQTGVRAM